MLTEKVDIWLCDNPDCNVQEVVREVDMLARGTVLTYTDFSGAGADGDDLWACSDKCLVVCVKQRHAIADAKRES